MAFVYKWARLSADRDLVTATEAATARIHQRLSTAGVDAPLMDAHYREEYYKPHMAVAAAKLRTCAYHVLSAVAATGRPSGEVALVDHGGGFGWIALVAKELGVGQVVYNDIDPLFLEAAQNIGAVAGAVADQYVLGDVEPLVEALGDRPVDAVVSYDVIEHIYDLDAFFEKLCSGSCRPRMMFMSSGANMFNPRYLRYVFPIQRTHEKLWAEKRAALITNLAPDLDEKQIAQLAKATRMMIAAEIEAVVHSYVDGQGIVLPKKTGANRYDPYRRNTLDPETGWWAEHLVSPFYFRRCLRRYGYRTKILSGFYANRGDFLNPVLRSFGRTLPLPIAPFYTVRATTDPGS
jgi:2-polyprenyl-3-methyl-5-hydroxy-6-metoxy-1,4-benzoquinol methylase